ncbi:hypothetical protein BT63DRAFT_423070 [Microthyrium microscopicum]|uniref:F-box domain-containing protein n=1 Tax=Microthyrium microscopicum TaxID=703497 RepID=A0A6A6UER5_9PEZI|nr:hypothetical protein BT63DRAFT_423070 [Microthyrium microscopicum]
MANQASKPGFQSIPAELLTQIFGELSTFNDVANLAATCRKFRETWNSNSTPIYLQVGPRAIPCEEYGRQFLADLTITPLKDLTMSKDATIKILKNAKVVRDAIGEFESNIVPHVQCGRDTSETYSPPNQHPPQLTNDERCRFTRAYYQMWSFLVLTPSSLQDRMQVTSLQQLYYLLEMADFENFGVERGTWPNMAPWLRYPWYPGADFDDGSVLASHLWAQDGGFNLHELKMSIQREMDRKYQALYRKNAPIVFSEGWENGARNFYALWDHGQEVLDRVLNNPVG